MEEPLSISGIYPSLAVFSHEGECGIGAVVPWAGKLWCVTYSPHSPHGSADKLCEISPDLTLVARPESIGGTPANRMIHRESNQLIIGPYFIDANGCVRAVAYSEMPGRHTATMRHLTEPATKVYFFCMEGELYEVDVHSLDVRQLCGQHPIPGSHAKGAYTSQGRVVVANNGEWDWYSRWHEDNSYDGETGALAQWDGAHWSVIERKQFCEVTGPGGIRGARDDTSPIWATGWDSRSVILKLLDGGRWYTYRLPKASHTYDGGHGWHTEWPRIREVSGGRRLMTMHGMLYDFPRTFSAANVAGLRPLATYLKMVVDFCNWNGRLVLACDDTSLFDNPLAGQAQSNLWFGQLKDLHGFGRPAGWGGVWVDDPVQAGVPSTPFLFAGFERRMVHLQHDSPSPVTFTLELDERGDGNWTQYRSVTVDESGYACHVFPEALDAEWVRVRTDRDCNATAYFHYSSPTPAPRSPCAPNPDHFRSLAPIGHDEPRATGIIRPRGHDRGTLQFLAQRVDPHGRCQPAEYYEIGPDMNLCRLDDPGAAQSLAESAGLGEPGFTVDAASAILTDTHGNRYRLPKSHPGYDEPWPEGWPRCVREVVTERSLINCHGTLYELPRDSSGGIRALRPICTHNRMIADFCSWRGLLVLVGTAWDAMPDGHYIASDDGHVGLWFGGVDDLWLLGKPRGHGGPWRRSPVRAHEPSDPYLMTGYDTKTLDVAHDSDGPVEFDVEIDFLATGKWVTCTRLIVPPRQALTYRFSDGFSAHWVRLRASVSCTAMALFTYG